MDERTIPAPIEKVWSLWTTKEGLESWWCPEGFKMVVQDLEVRVGGRIDFRYEDAATAANPAWSRVLQARGVSTLWTARGMFLVMDPLRRLAFQQALDFGAKSRPQEYRMTAEFRRRGLETFVVLAAEASPSKHWSLLGKPNLVGQLDRLTGALAAHSFKTESPS